MAKKTIDKDTKTTKVKNVETKNDVSNKKEDEIVNLEATDISEDKNDVSEVITHDNVSENVEKMDMPENVDLIEKTEATADMLNEETVEKNESENVEEIGLIEKFRKADASTKDVIVRLLSYASYLENRNHEN